MLCRNPMVKSFFFFFYLKKNIINFNEKTFLKYSERYVVLISITKKNLLKTIIVTVSNN